MATSFGIEMADGVGFAPMAQRLFGHLRLEFPDGSAPRRLRSRELADCRISSVEAGAHIAEAPVVRRRSYDPDTIKLVMPIAGSVRFTQCGHEVNVNTRDACLYDPTKPYRLAASSNAALLLVQLPRGIERLLLGENSAMFRTLAGPGVSILSERIADRLRDAGGSGDYSVIDDLIALCQEPLRSQGSLIVLRRRIEQFVRANLSCPDLTVGLIADRMGCSSRYVHRAFEAEGRTPGAYIWQARLARAHSRLTSVATTGRSIADVAFSVGFSSSSHFSRLFRSRYEISPSELRQRLQSEND